MDAASNSQKVIIITGASAGIGAATALAAAGYWKNHAKLVLGARRKDRLEAVAAKCREFGATAVPMVCDVSRREDVSLMVAAAVEQFGRLDVMLANAGFGLLAKIHQTTERQFDDIFATNVKGTLYCMQAAADVMLKQEPHGSGRSRRGHIIAVSSGAGRRSLPLNGVYSMTKAAQLSLTEAMRVELTGVGVYVSSVHPLMTATEFFGVASDRSGIPFNGVGPTQSAETVAKKIVRLIRHPRPELWPVTGSRFLLAFAAAFPGFADRIMARTAASRTR